jgi:hypothetical protein
MSAEIGQQLPSEEGYVATVLKDAMNWLNIVGRYDHEVSVRIDTPYNRANDEVFRYLGDRMMEGDFHTASLLATFERQAQQATSVTNWISDTEVQNAERTNTFYDFARTMNRFAGRPYDN